MTAAVFLDRDDTLIACNDLPPPPPPGKPGDLTDPGLVRLLPTVREALAKLHAAGFVLVVVSNQGGVARGAGRLRDVEAVNDALRRLAIDGQGRPLLHAAYYCPFHPSTPRVGRFTREHAWRKPGPGMVHAAAQELSIDLSTSWMVGDAARDIEAGIAAGISPERCLRVGPGAPCPTLLDAARLILRESFAPREARDYTTARLAALSGTPLKDKQVRESVETAAAALAERTGVRLIALRTDERGIEADIVAPEIIAVGFAAELRRITNAWYEAKFRDGPLWGTPPPVGDASA